MASIPVVVMMTEEAVVGNGHQVAAATPCFTNRLVLSGVAVQLSLSAMEKAKQGCRRQAVIIIR